MTDADVITVIMKVILAGAVIAMAAIGLACLLFPDNITEDAVDRYHVVWGYGFFNRPADNNSGVDSFADYPSAEMKRRVMQAIVDGCDYGSVTVIYGREVRR